jgi:hypothetical protein
MIEISHFNSTAYSNEASLEKEGSVGETVCGVNAVFGGILQTVPMSVWLVAHRNVLL